MCGMWRGGHVRGEGGTCVAKGDMHGKEGGMRSTADTTGYGQLSGLYASYWNAFLLKTVLKNK